MAHQKVSANLFFCLVLCAFIVACNNEGSPEKKIVSNPNEMNEQAAKLIEKSLEFALKHNGKISDSIQLKLLPVVTAFYKSNEYTPVWSKRGKWNGLADAMVDFVKKSENYGLFPAAYNLKDFYQIKSSLDKDSLKRLDAAMWSQADMLLTDAFMHLVKDLKYGRLATDTTFKKDSTENMQQTFSGSLKKFMANKSFTSLAASLEPSLSGYTQLKQGLINFLDSMDRKTYTYVTYPFKKNDTKDSLFFVKLLQKRLVESDCIDSVTKLPDSVKLHTALKRYQKQNNLKMDGKISASLIRAMNNTDLEKFKRIAINLDRYKQMPEVMPEKYIWVNIPGYYLKLIDNDTIVIESKVICGKPDTKTPMLYSVIEDMVTYPTWTVPNSIIKKNYLPKLKNNPYYLSRIGLHLVDSKGETVDPGKIKWSKYSNGIPYKVMQGSGDDNALGIMKFNFKNPFSVYLHDTNQRYLFKNASRALSHGCVRVEQWDKLAYYIARNDSIYLKEGEQLKYNSDSIRNWLAKKQKRRIDVKTGIPLFIAYFSCEGRGDKIKFYDDVYGEDKKLREKFFRDK